MKILLLGAGGREHALAWKIKQSSHCDQLYIAPGNPGTAECGININIKTTEFDKLAAFAIQENIDMVVVGPEDALVNGIVDYFSVNEKVKHIPVIGPDKKAAQLEGSKTFAKAFMLRNGVQTPAYKEYSKISIAEAYDYLNDHLMPVVIKADGLAAGKGVLISQNPDEAKTAIQEMFEGKFGAAGNKIVVEEFLHGIELTVIILCDGNNYIILPTSKDYKKAGDGDTGLNTGGMGAISPPDFATESFMNKVIDKIIEPTLAGLKKENIIYKGFLYFGLFNCNDEPYLIEYNVRLGDPETQVILPRIKNDIVDLFNAVAQVNIHAMQAEIDERACATVILASDGYPEQFEIGKKITGIENTENSLIFQAGTTLDENGNLLSNGGRILAVSAYGNDLNEALRICYVNTGRIYFDTRYFRRDIGWDI